MANEIYREIFVTREEYTPPIQYVQGANAIPIVVRVCDYNIPSGSKANVFVKKPSGKSVQDTAVIDGNTVTIDVTTQMFAEVGTSIIQIQITNGQDVLITFDLPAMVRKNRTEPGAPESENEAAFFTELQEAANKARIAAQEANNAAQAAEDALSVLEGAVEGTIINDDTPSDVTTFSGRHIENTFLKKNGDGGNVIVTFQKAADRAGIESGDSLAVAFGKLAKFFTDIQSYVFSPPVNNLLSTDTSRPLSAEMGKQLQEKIDQLNSALINKIDNLQRTKPVEYVNNLFMGGVSFFIIDSDVAHQIDLPDSSWWYVLHIAKPDNTGFAVQFFIELHGAGRVLRRWSSESAWVGRNW